MDFSQRVAGIIDWRTTRPRSGDTIEIAADWDGPLVNGDDYDWLALSAGDQVTIKKCTEGGSFFVQKQDGDEGWIGGHGCMIRIVFDLPLGLDEDKLPRLPRLLNEQSTKVARERPLMRQAQSVKKQRTSVPPPPMPAVPPPPQPAQPQRMGNRVSPMEVATLIEQRNQARKDKQFQLSDKIRDSLRARGVCLIDEKGAKGDLLGQQVTVWHYQGDPPESASAVFSEEHINIVIEERNEARKASDFRKADEIRDWLHSNGIILRDEKGAKGELSGHEVTSWHYRDSPPAPVAPPPPPFAAPPPPPAQPQRMSKRVSPMEVATLIEQRNQARKDKQFQLSDKIRDSLRARGVCLIDEKGAKGDLLGQQVTVWHYQGDPPESATAVFSEEHIDIIIEERNEARKASDFRKADEIRDWLHSNGIILRDEKGAKGEFSGHEVTSWHYRDSPPAPIAPPPPPVAAPPPPPVAAPPPPPVAPEQRGRVSGQSAQTHHASGRPTEQEILRLIEQRNEARKSKQFAKSDEIRDWLKAWGVILQDQKGVQGDHYGQQITSWHYA